MEGINNSITIEKILDIVYPVGCYYWSKSSTNPASLFGGTWEQVKDKFVLAAGDDYDEGTTGGEAAHALTVNEMPSHYHDMYLKGLGGTTTTPAYYAALKADAYKYQYENGVTETLAVAVTTKEGGGAAHNNMPPYIVAYCFVRTA